VTFIQDRVGEALISQICLCYQAFIQIYQVEHRENLQTWKAEINFRDIDEIIEKVRQEYLSCYDAIGFGWLYNLGIPAGWIGWALGISPISLDINKISDPQTCLEHLTQQAPSQTLGIQQLICKTGELFQKRTQYGLFSCDTNIQKYVWIKTKTVLSKNNEGSCELLTSN
jgi:hypothetical protein